MLDIEKNIKKYLDKVDDVVYFNSQKVLNAFIKEEVSENDFNIPLVMVMQIMVETKSKEYMQIFLNVRML